MISILAISKEKGRQVVKLINANDPNFSFIGWHYHPDNEGIQVNYAWGNKDFSVDHRFDNNSNGIAHEIDIELDYYCA